MAEAFPLPKPRVRFASEGCPQKPRERQAPRPASRPTFSHPAGLQHVADRALAVESDLSCDMVIGDEELDAITRLLGEALDCLLFGF
jgi:hypothetical protein